MIIRLLTLLLATILSLSLSAKPAGNTPRLDVGSPIVGTHRTFPECQLFVAVGDDDFRPLESPYSNQRDPTKSMLTAGDPFSVAVNRVTLPREGFHRGNVAVIINVTTGSTEGSPVVVFYQENAVAGQQLNFRDILVHSEPELHIGAAPYIRVRVLRVGGGLAEDIVAKLKLLQELPSRMPGIVLHPAIPLVQLGIEAATSLLSDKKASTLIDFQFQLYSREDNASSGNSLMSLQTGQWYVLGLPAGTRLHSPVIEPASGRVFERKDGIAQPLSYPSVGLTMLKAAPLVSPAVLDASKALIDLLQNPNSLQSPATVESTVKRIYSAGRTMALVSGMERTTDAVVRTGYLRRLGDMLADDLLRQEQGKESLLEDTDRSFAGKILRKYIPENQHDFVASPTNFIRWWVDQKNREGAIKDSGSVSFDRKWSWALESIISRDGGSILTSAGPPRDVLQRLVNWLRDKQDQSLKPNEWDLLVRICRESIGDTNAIESLDYARARLNEALKYQVITEAGKPARFVKPTIEDRLAVVVRLLYAGNISAQRRGLEQLQTILNSKSTPGESIDVSSPSWKITELFMRRALGEGKDYSVTENGSSRITEILKLSDVDLAEKLAEALKP